MEPEGATEHMRTLSGSVIDPAVMDAFASSVSRRQTLGFLAEDLAIPAE
jgi:HD-GYP domain-containing protein (c-di-GMP phosphodiesterase class II)